MIILSDNDYFFIDVNLNNDSSNIDKIKNFYVSGFDSSAKDYLVFSAEQLGFSSSSATGGTYETIDAFRTLFVRIYAKARLYTNWYRYNNKFFW